MCYFIDCSIVKAHDIIVLNVILSFPQDMSPIVGGVIAATSGNQQQHTNLMSGGLKEEDVDPSSYDGSKWKFDYFPQQHLKAWKQTDFYFINMYHNFCSLFCCFC